MRSPMPWVVAIALALVPCSVLSSQQAARYFNPPSLSKPTGYTHVVIAPDGRTVHLAGQVALDSTGQLVGSGDFRRQADQVFQNLRRALESVDGGLDDLVKTTTYITDLGNLPALRAVREKYLGAARPPASTLLVVSGLARPELLIEIEGIAVLRQTVRRTGGE